METFDLLLIVWSIWGALMLYCAFMLHRNTRVHDIRVAFINDRALFPLAYEALPSYDAMLYNPRYWLLWTKEHWVAWLARRQAEVA